MRQLSGSFLTKKEELSFGEADSQRRNPLGLSIKKYEYLWNSLYVKKYDYLWNRVVANLAPIFSDARSGTIANKNQKRITAGGHPLTHATDWFSS